MKKIQCPCCGYYTISTEDEIIVDICEVCFWQYDTTAHKYPEKSIGPNSVSLNEARVNYIKYGVSEKRFIDKNLTREPYPEEFPDQN